MVCSHSSVCTTPHWGRMCSQHSLDGCPPLPSCRLCPVAGSSWLSPLILVPYCSTHRCPAARCHRSYGLAMGWCAGGGRAHCGPFVPQQCCLPLPRPLRAAPGCAGAAAAVAKPQRLPCWQQAQGVEPPRPHPHRGAAIPCSFIASSAELAQLSPGTALGPPQLGRSAAPSAALTTALHRGPAVSIK